MHETVDIRLIERLGSGLYGVAWRAEQISLRRIVAVKLIKREMAGAATALDHARALARVKHPNVVTVHCVAPVNDPTTNEIVDCVVMDLLEGETFGSRLQGEKYRFSECIGYCIQLLKGVDAIHEEGVAHSDLHDGNVILSGGVVKIIDIGYTNADSLTRLGSLAKESLIAADTDAARGIIYRALRHSDAPLDVLSDLEERLRAATTTQMMRDALHGAAEFRTITSPNGHAHSSLRVTNFAFEIGATGWQPDLLPPMFEFRVNADVVNDGQVACRNWGCRYELLNGPPTLWVPHEGWVGPTDEIILHSARKPIHMVFGLRMPEDRGQIIGYANQLSRLTLKCRAISEQGEGQSVEWALGPSITNQCSNEIASRLVQWFDRKK